MPPRLANFARPDSGNITETTIDDVTTTRTVNSLNQLTATGTDSQYMSELAYDAAGAMTTDSLGRTLVYDAWGRLTEVRSGQTVVQNLTYDGTGRLIIRSDAAAPTDSYFTGTQDIEERTGVTAQSNGTAGVLTFFSPVYVNALIARDRDTDANGTLDQRVYFTCDANFNVTSVISAAGTALQHQVYDAYGNVTFTGTDADWTPLSPNADGYAQEHLYQGMLRNAAIGWYFAGQSNVGRWYGPAEMTWSRADSAGYIDGASLYAFVAANPINRLDPLGLQTRLPDTDPSLALFPDEHTDNINQKFRSVNVDLGDILIGQSNDTPETVTVPAIFDKLLLASASRSQKTITTARGSMQQEWGGAITVDRSTWDVDKQQPKKDGAGKPIKPTFRIWPPVGGSRESVDAAASFPNTGAFLQIGVYHSHTNENNFGSGHTLFSQEDFASVMGNNKLWFSLLTNCGGDTSWLLIARPNVKRDGIVNYKRPYPTPTEIAGGKFDWNAWQIGVENSLVKDADAHNVLLLFE
jgi:RHS repeat-associated protein